MTIREREEGWSWAQRKEAKRARMQGRQERQADLMADISRQFAADEATRELERFAFTNPTATASVTQAETNAIDRLETDRKAESIYNAIMQARTW